MKITTDSSNGSTATVEFKEREGHGNYLNRYMEEADFSSMSMVFTKSKTNGGISDINDLSEFESIF